MLPLIRVLCRYLKCTPEELKNQLEDPEIMKIAMDFLTYNFSAFDEYENGKKYRIWVCDNNPDRDHVGKVPVYSGPRKKLMFHARYFSFYVIQLKYPDLMAYYTTPKDYVYVQHNLEDVKLELSEPVNDEMAREIYLDLINEDKYKNYREKVNVNELIDGFSKLSLEDRM